MDLDMNKSLEDNLYQAILKEEKDKISHLLKKGANPNKTASFGKTCLGEAANKGNVEITKMLIDFTISSSNSSVPNSIPKSIPKKQQKKRHSKSQKRKFKNDCQPPETIVKHKNTNDTKEDIDTGQCDSVSTKEEEESKSETNQGYFVIIHSEGSSSEESKIPSSKSPLSPPSLTPSPQSDLEWDEEIDNETPVVITREDDTWSKMYLWYAAILESTGAAIASASAATNGIDQQDTYMRAPLHYAVEQGHQEIVQLLLKAGCKYDLPAIGGLTSLHIAVIKNHVEIAKQLLAAGSNVNNKTHEKSTSLHFAATRGFLDMVKVLVSNGANLEARDNNDCTPLYQAVFKGHVNVVKCLILSGANVNTEQMHGHTPLCEAVWQKFTMMVEVLLASGARITHSHKLLHDAITQEQEPIIRMLLYMGGGINLHDDNGDTPLHLAARLSQPKIVRLLLSKGANINACNSITGGNTLHIAVENVLWPMEFEELLMCLLEYKIDMNTAALTGDTALNRALLLYRDDAAVSLIRYGANVNIWDQSCGLDNLSIVSRRSSPYLACILIKAGHSLPIYDEGAPIPVKESTNSLYWIYCAAKEPLSLSDICRIKIRRLWKRGTLLSYICNLPLPTSLKRFLMMEDCM